MDKLEKMEILLVDDRPDNLLVLESVIEGLDVNIFKATSGNDALALMLDHDFGLVILDVQMPGMDGFEVADLMKGMEKTRNIPIIFLTANSKEESSVFKGYEVGAVDYLFKPIQPIILCSKVKVFVSLYEQKIQLRVQANLLEERIQELLQLKEMKTELETLSQIDGLTGIPNRRTLDNFMKKNWVEALNKSEFLSFIMIDIDHFKAYNDNYGHIQGDECLIQVAKLLSSTFEKYKDCLVGRYGGEEFSAILPTRSQEETLEIVKRIQENLQSVAIVHEYSPIMGNITFSIGTVSVVPTTDMTIQDIMGYADQALYEAKSQGRNRVVFYDSLVKESSFIIE